MIDVDFDIEFFLISFFFQNSKEDINKLYDLLLSDDTTAMAVNNEQEWDSSTVSSGLDNEIESSESGVSYYKSTSGFHVRL